MKQEKWQEILQEVYHKILMAICRLSKSPFLFVVNGQVYGK